MRNALIAAAVIAAGVGFWWYFATGVTGQRRAADASHPTSSSRERAAEPRAAHAPARHGASDDDDDADVVASLGYGTEVHGIVADLAGGPIAGARVTVYVTDHRVRALSGADGAYHLAIPPGRWTIDASHDDYARERDELIVGEQPTAHDFALVPGGTVRGHVVARDTGAPVGGAHVFLVAHDEDRGWQRAVAEPDGSFAFHSVPAGAFDASATARGYASLAPQVVGVGLGQQVADVRITVEPAHAIRGRVVRAGTGEGVAGVGVFAAPAGVLPGGLAAEPTDARGAFEILGALPGAYRVGASQGIGTAVAVDVTVADRDAIIAIEVPLTAALHGHVEPRGRAQVRLGTSYRSGGMLEYGPYLTDEHGAFEIRTVARGAYELTATASDGGAGRLDVVADGTERELVIALAPRAAVRGRVLDDADQPVAGAIVVGVPRKGENVHARSGPDGAYALAGLPAGGVSVYAAADEHAWRADPARPALDLTLRDAEVRTGVDLRAPARDGELHGRVVDASGSPAADALVAVKRTYSDGDTPYPWDPATATALARADGSFAIAGLPRGAYLVDATDARGAARGTARGSTGDAVSVSLAPLGALSGRVTDSEGAPVPAYAIWCRRAAAMDVARRVASADGAYALDHLEPGHYICSAASAAGCADDSVQIGAGAAHLDLALRAYATVAGVLLDAHTDLPLADFSVIAHGGGAGVLSDTTAITDAAGRFVLLDAPAGTHLLSVQPRSSLDITGLDSIQYTAKPGEHLDLGSIRATRAGD